MNNGKELLKLMQENPDLPIVPMVDGEVCEDGDGYWMGSFGYAEVNEYVYVKDRFCTRDYQEDIEDYLSDDLCDEYPDLSDEDYSEMVHRKAEALPWKKAIIVYIGLPEV